MLKITVAERFRRSLRWHIPSEVDSDVPVADDVFYFPESSLRKVFSQFTAFYLFGKTMEVVNNGISRRYSIGEELFCTLESNKIVYPDTQEVTEPCEQNNDDVNDILHITHRHSRADEHYGQNETCYFSQSILVNDR